MKNLLSLTFLGLFLLLFSSCSNDVQSVKQDGKTETRSNVQPNFIGVHMNNTVTITVSNEVILNEWNALLSEIEITLILTELLVENFENNYYLVAKGEGVKSVRAVLIDQDGNALVDTKITCTTTDCSDTPKCMPVGHICTACDNKGKCTKSVST
ncbi:MAG: hypothetical protein IPM42_06665 [Saprospiraceae bacterium]|nr:hypothetical protein [Saprospiraceae bacterium]